MHLTFTYLFRFPKIFRAMTGLDVPEFKELVLVMLPSMVRAERQRLKRRDRQRDLGAGHPFELGATDRLLLTIIWLRLYPTQDVLGFLFGVSDTTVGRYIKLILPLLEKAGGDTMRLPDPGRKRRRELTALYDQVPDLKAVVIDTFEQRIQRPLDRQDADLYYSGKKRQHTLKSQVAVDLFNGCFVNVAPSVRGPTADLTVYRESQLGMRLPRDVARLFDLAYVGVEAESPENLCILPRRKPRNQLRPPNDVIHNTMAASCRIQVEHSIARLRRYEALNQRDRHHRQHHTARVVSVAGLVNRQIQHRQRPILK